MSPNIITLAFLCLITLTLTHISTAQNSQSDYLNAHNTARAADGVGNVVWSTSAAAYAQNYANARIGDCALVNSGGTTYGENIAKGSGGTFTGIAAVNQWAGENTNYNYDSNLCNTGTVCSHYTQVVWNATAEIGCARVLCANGAFYFVVCSYLAKGNVSGQRPYIKP